MKQTGCLAADARGYDVSFCGDSQAGDVSLPGTVNQLALGQEDFAMSSDEETI